ncbi:MAG: hypothetical protein H7293_18225 [Candidatus Saccharibacteria bacterium]|nr:hypothetical protein [Rhodoferax sp.]
MTDQRKDLPPANSPQFLEKVREALSTYLGGRGDRLDRGLTVRDLYDTGFISLKEGFLNGRGGAGGSGPTKGPGPALMYEVDLTPPPAPDGLSAKTSGTSIQVTINPQTYRQGHGPGKVIVFGAKYIVGDPLPTYAAAAVLGEFTGDVHAFPVDPGALYRIWAKSVSVDGVESAITGGTNGVEPVTGLLDDASIASLTASKIRSGSITVGQFIQAANYVPNLAGWRIDGSGTAEFQTAIVRGTVFAASGVIGGNTINSTGVQSPNYSAGLTGWRLASTGVITAYSGAGANQFNLAATGTIPAIKLGSQFYVLGNGSAYFGGTLAANTVTADTIVSQSIGKPFALFTLPQPDTGAIGGATLDNAAGMVPLLVIGPRNAVAGYLFGTASVSGAYLVAAQYGTLTTQLVVEEYTGDAGAGSVTVNLNVYQTATAADSRTAGVNVYAMPVTVFALALRSDTRSVKITFSAKNNNAAQVAYLSNVAVAGAVLQR